MKKSTVIALALATAALGAPTASAQAPTLGVDPLLPCYREQQTVMVPGSGFTPNGAVVFTRGGSTLGQIVADPSGQLAGRLELPGLASGQQQLTYTATDQTNPALVANLSLLVTATDVNVRPRRGVPSRLLTIGARGFFGGKRLWAHVVRSGRPARTARNVRIGRVKGPCKKVRARKRIFPVGAAPGTYRVQFDTFRRYKSRRLVEAEFIVNVFRTARGATAASTNWVRVR